MDTRTEVIRGIRTRSSRARARTENIPDPKRLREREPTIPRALIALPFVALVAIAMALVALSAVTTHPSLTRAYIVSRPEEPPPRGLDADDPEDRSAPDAVDSR